MIPGHPFYLHECLEDSSLHLPEVVKPPRVSANNKMHSLLSESVYRRSVSPVRIGCADQHTTNDVIMKPNSCIPPLFLSIPFQICKYLSSILRFPFCCRTLSSWRVWRRSKPNLPTRNTKESHVMSTLRCVGSH